MATATLPTLNLSETFNNTWADTSEEDGEYLAHLDPFDTWSPRDAFFWDWVVVKLVQIISLNQKVCFRASGPLSDCPSPRPSRLTTSGPSFIPTGLMRPTHLLPLLSPSSSPALHAPCLVLSSLDALDLQSSCSI
jgi:hypothetical protein